MLAPIVLFVYNRPEHTRQTVEALQKNELAKDSVLYIFADGAKSNATEEQKTKIQETRDYIHCITGFKEIQIEESPQNKGLANSVIYGVTKIINKYGTAIVLEDDLISHPLFLTFMNDALKTYKGRDDIYMISGLCNNIKIPFWYRKDVYLLHRSCSWGWGTWKEKWNLADWDVSDFQKMKQDRKRIGKFNRGGRDMFDMLTAQKEGKIDSWAIRWDYTMNKYDGMTLHPTKTFLKNIGMDGSGTHKSYGDKETFIAPYYGKENYCLKCSKNVRICKTIEYRYVRFVDGLYNREKCTIKRFIKKIVSHWE